MLRVVNIYIPQHFLTIMKYHMRHLFLQTIILLAVFAITYTQQELQPQALKLKRISIEMAQLEDQSFTVDELIKKIASQQQQTNRKLLQHYLQKKVQNDWKLLESENIKLRIYDQFSGDQKIAALQVDVKKFLQDTLYGKFEMSDLSRSFQQQIKENPAEYFLNADMYDLIIDGDNDL